MFFRMSGPSEQTEPPFFAMGRVALTVNDLDRVRGYYEEAVGLHLLRNDGETAELGAEGRTLLELRRDPAARRRSPREAGLFHTAFLLPERRHLGRWLRHAAGSGVRLTGASDHWVSEAVYLTDPEGNGIEIYSDRPRSAWRWRDGFVEMATEPLDLDGLVGDAGEERWEGAPEGTAVGHVHLQVGEIAPAEAFYSETLGMEITCRYRGGSFYAADGYHHHMATNIWNSQGAGTRSYPSTGLSEVEIQLDPARAAAIRDRAGSPDGGGSRFALRDPWGTSIAIKTVA